jgi:serine/threonine protein kinase
VDENRLHYPCEIDEDAKNFIEIIVQKDPKQRPKCKELLTHPFITINTK